MANSPYQAPSVNITEISSPSYSPLLDRPTTIALVGEAQNYLSSTEILLLADLNAVPLKQSGVDTTTIVVKDALNPLVTYTANDYVLTTNATTGRTYISRNLYTTIPNNSDVVAVMNTASPTGVNSRVVTLSEGTPSPTIIPTNGATTVNAVTVQSKGIFTQARDITVAVTSSTATVTRRASGSLVVDGQTVYVNYTTGAGAVAHTDAVTLVGTTASHLSAEASAVDAASIVVYNVDPRIDTTLNAVSPSVIVYLAGATEDYVVTPALPSANFTLTRSINGPTTIGITNNRAQVRVTYQATPVNYYQPTRVFSPSDVEALYGLAIDGNGNINSPLSFAALMAFNGGASDLVVQPLFHSVDGTTGGARTRPVIDNKNTYLNDWTSSIQALRDLEDVNVIVPVISHTNVTTLADGDILSIFQKVQTHINTMNTNRQYVVGIYGEDSTSGTRAFQSVLQAHAGTLQAGLLPERQVLVSPASFDFPNTRSAQPLPIGGQYAAAAVAGMLAGRPISQTLTRRAVPGLLDVNDFRSDIDKDSDAQSGLLVIERKNGRVQVRHAITTAVNDPYTRELSVIRAKHYMLESLRLTIDTQLIGQIVADSSAPHTVSATVQGVLENLMTLGVIVGYGGIQARSLAPGQPSTIECRFVYQPPFPLNYIEIIFSFDASGASVGATA